MHQEQTMGYCLDCQAVILATDGYCRECHPTGLETPQPVLQPWQVPNDIPGEDELWHHETP